MKKKELKNLAKKIAKYELILQSSIDPKEKEQAQNEIMKLTSEVHNFEDIDILDEMIQEFLEKNIDL